MRRTLHKSCPNHTQPPNLRLFLSYIDAGFEAKGSGRKVIKIDEEARKLIPATQAFNNRLHRFILDSHGGVVRHPLAAS